MSLNIIKTGLSDTLQDNGRYGYAKWGVNPSGVMDRYAAPVANALVGNNLEDAVIEMHFPACQIVFEDDVLIALTGADFSPAIDGNSMPLWKPLLLRKGALLSFPRKKTGARCYLAVQGGFDVAPWLGSVSTNQKISAGGFEGRALRKGDRIPIKASRYVVEAKGAGVINALPWSVNFRSVYENPSIIFFVEGNEWNWLDSQSKKKVLEEVFTTDPSSDRMGYYLKGDPIKLQHTSELLSSAVTYGTMQALPDGKILVLMADHQTTGGYPRIGYVIAAHLPKLSQLGANEKLSLKMISASAAENMLFSLQRELRLIQQACRGKLDRYYAQH